MMKKILLFLIIQTTLSPLTKCLANVDTCTAVELLLAGLRLPAGIAPHLVSDQTKPSTAKALLLTRDGVRIASSITSIYLHNNYNKYNIGWLIKDLFSLITTMNLAPEKYRATTGSLPLATLCYSIEAGATAAAALCKANSSCSAQKAQKRLTLLQGLASLARTAQYLIEETEFTTKAQVKLVLTLTHLIILLLDCKVELNEVSPQRPFQSNDLLAKIGMSFDDQDFLGIDGSPQRHPQVQLNTTVRPTVTYQQNLGFKITRPDTTGVQHEFRYSSQSMPGSAFVILPCNHLLRDRQAERYSSQCPICHHDRSEILSLIPPPTNKEWWGRLPETMNDGSEIVIPLQAYNKTSQDALAAERGEIQVPPQLFW